MPQSHPMPVLSRNERTEAETVDRAVRSQHPVVITLPDPASEPAVEKMRGPKLVALWAALIALSWAVAIGIGYTVYRAVSVLF
ncbi:hypothetical protein [Azospirillum sp. sgz301742]